MLAEAERLAEEFMGKAPRTAEIISVATDLAHEVILLGAIRRERRSLLSTPMPRDQPTVYKARGMLDALNALYSIPALEEVDDWGGVNAFLQKTAGRRRVPLRERRQRKSLMKIPSLLEERSDEERLIDRIVSSRKEFHRLDEYERKALSRRAKLITRLDYLILEERRRRVSSSSGGRGRP